jgi:hypothetical protein
LQVSFNASLACDPGAVPAIEDGGDGVGTISKFGKAALAGLVWFMAGDETILILA